MNVVLFIYKLAWEERIGEVGLDPYSQSRMG
jgi:hypothetical protein